MAHPSLLVVFLLVWARIGGAIMAAPIFSERAIPMLVKAGLSAAIAGILTPAQMTVAGPISSDPASFVVLLGEQILLGLAFALVFVVVYRAAEAAGELIGQQMGVTLGMWMGGDGDNQMHSIGQLYHIVASLIFLALDGQHWVILGLGASLNAMPVTHVTLAHNLVNTLMSLGTAAVMFAVGLALPLLVTLLLADIITGLIGRSIPALNLFVIGLPLKVALAVAGLIIAAPFTVALLSQYLLRLPTIRLW